MYIDWYIIKTNQSIIFLGGFQNKNYVLTVLTDNSRQKRIGKVWV